jgi:hypothetical protein
MPQTKICKTCSQPFEVTDHELALYKKFARNTNHSEDPAESLPDLCFEDLQKRHLCLRNERHLYTRKCDATGETIVSQYSEEKPHKIYKNDYWYSDKWDPLEHGRDPDFTRPFFDQLQELQLKIPRLSLSNMKSVNSDYCNMTVGNKNCYLIFGGDYNEDSMYGVLSMHNRDVVECDYSNHCEFCYEISDCLKCYNCDYSRDCKSCHDCSYVSDCISCNNCILCTNLINQSYCIENKPVPKEEYEKRKQALLSPENRKRTYDRFLDLFAKRIVKFAHAIHCENSTGDYLKNCKNCINCFDTSEGEDICNVIFATEGKDCFNSTLLGHKSQLCYDSIATFTSYNPRHSFFTVHSTDIEYCDISINCSNLFGCVGLRHKKYCILNKQYDKPTYESLRKKLINHMVETGEYGQFLPQSMSCFGYNESTAHAYYPLTKDQALAQGYKWTD